jgi:hypothetical protein
LDYSDTLSVVSGLIIGGAFVVVFSIVFSASSFAPAQAHNEINLAIEGMKSTYKSGEQIVFSVSAKGISDNACNIAYPGVSIHGGGEEKINWPISFGFNTAMGCGGPESLDKEWMFGGEPKNEIVLDTPGSYILVVSVEDTTIEKQFVVTGDTSVSFVMDT